MSESKPVWTEKVLDLYKDSMENLPAIDEPSGYEKRIAYAVAMVNNGATATVVAKELGVAVEKVYKAVKGLGYETPNEFKRAAEQKITEQAVMLTVAAQEKAMEMLEEGRMRPAEVIKLAQTARDTVASRFNWKESNRESTDKTNNALAAALEAFAKKLPAPDPVAEAVEVEVLVESEQTPDPQVEEPLVNLPVGSPE